MSAARRVKEGGPGCGCAASEAAGRLRRRGWQKAKEERADDFSNRLRSSGSRVEYKKRGGGRDRPCSLTSTQRKNSSPFLTSSNLTSSPNPSLLPSMTFSSCLQSERARSMARLTSSSFSPLGAAPRRVAWAGKAGPGRDLMSDSKMVADGSEVEGASQSEYAAGSEDECWEGQHAEVDGTGENGSRHGVLTSCGSAI